MPDRRSGAVIAAVTDDDDASAPVATRTPIFAPRARTAAHAFLVPTPVAAVVPQPAAAAAPARMDRALASILSQLQTMTAAAAAQADVLRTMGARHAQLEQRLDAISAAVADESMGEAVPTSPGPAAPAAKRSRSAAVPSPVTVSRDPGVDAEPVVRKRPRSDAPPTTAPADASSSVIVAQSDIIPLFKRPAAAPVVSAAAVASVLSGLDSDTLRAIITSWLAEEVPAADGSPMLRMEQVASRWYFTSREDGESLVAAATAQLNLPPGSMHTKARNFCVGIMKDSLRADNRNAIARVRDSLMTRSTLAPCVLASNQVLDPVRALWHIVKHDRATALAMVAETDDDFVTIMRSVFATARGDNAQRYAAWCTRRRAYVLAAIMTAFTKRSRELSINMSAACGTATMPAQVVNTFAFDLIARARALYVARDPAAPGGAKDVTYADMCAAIEQELLSEPRSAVISVRSLASTTPTVAAAAAVDEANGSKQLRASAASAAPTHAVTEAMEAAHATADSKRSDDGSGVTIVDSANGASDPPPDAASSSSGSTSRSGSSARAFSVHSNIHARLGKHRLPSRVSPAVVPDAVAPEHLKKWEYYARQ